MSLYFKNTKIQVRSICWYLLLALFYSINLSGQQLNTSGVIINSGEIILKPDFTAETGTDFRAYIENGGKIAWNRTARIDWSMEKRFGLDNNNNGIMDLPNTNRYAVPNPDAYKRPAFQVNLSVIHQAPTKQELGVSTLQLRAILNSTRRTKWIVNGKIRTSNNKNNTSLLLLEDRKHRIQVEVTYAYKNKIFIYQSPVETIEVEDILIIAIGDSFASGEGNPERPEYDKKGLKWADGQVEYITKDHEAAHRSTLCWSAQAALQLENASNKTSVTYINLAETGGLIRNSVSQLGSLRKIIGAREVDALLISTGGNDIGFSYLISTLLGRNKHDKVFSLKSIQSAFHSGNWLMLTSPLDNFLLQYFDHLMGIKPKPQLPGLNELSYQYGMLNTNISNWGINSSKVYIMEYPNLSTYKDGNQTKYCEEMLTRVVEIARPGDDGIGLIDREEAQWVVDYAVPKLNSEIKKASQKHKWNYIGGIVEKFDGRGLCVGSKFKKSWYKGNPFPKSLPSNEDPYRRWVRQAKESKEIQACHGSRKKKCKTRYTMGMVHPNEFGHQAIAQSFLSIFDKK